MFNCIIKRAFDCSDNIQWEALYVDGFKVLENFEIDLDKALPIFSPNSKCEEVELKESDFEDIEMSFPLYEDFSYLLDYRDIEIGSKVWLDDGEWEVSEVTEGYRESGNYEYVEWICLTPHRKTITYVGHTIKKFKVKGKKITFVWEDYNYQQSFIYEYLNFIKNI